MVAGRKPKYTYWLTEQGQNLITNWLAKGLTEKEIAETKMHVKQATLIEWKKKFDELNELFLRKKDLLDAEIQDSIYKHAIGYYVNEIKVVEFADGSKRTEKTRKWIKGDVTAQMFILQNRDPEHWKNVKTIENNVSIKNPYENLTEEQLLKLAGSDETE